MVSNINLHPYGAGYYWDQHDMRFYVLIQIIAGVFQSTGWPSVVSVMGNWFGKSKRGLIMAGRRRCKLDPSLKAPCFHFIKV